MSPAFLISFCPCISTVFVTNEKSSRKVFIETYVSGLFIWELLREWGLWLALQVWLLVLHCLNDIDAHQSFGGAVPEKPARLFVLPLKSTARPQMAAMPSGSPAHERLFFLVQPTQTYLHCFHRAV